MAEAAKKTSAVCLLIKRKLNSPNEEKEMEQIMKKKNFS